MSKGALWVEKYRPKTLEHYIMADSFLGRKVQEWIKEKSIPHLWFSGPAGGGKTSLIEIILSQIVDDPADILTINASEKNNVATIREDIANFASTMAIGNIKVVFLDECDQLSPDAQGIMRKLMEECSDTVRFVLACNNENRIIPPIVSRCQHFRFKPADRLDVMERCIHILSAEKVQFNLELLDNFVAIGFPDMRKIIQLLQQYSIDGVLHSPSNAEDTGDYKFKLVELIEKDDWTGARKLICSSVGGEEWEEVYRFLYKNINRSPKFMSATAWDQAIIVIAEHLYKHTLCADAEINCASMLIQLGQIH